MIWIVLLFFVVLLFWSQITTCITYKRMNYRHNLTRLKIDLLITLHEMGIL